MGMTGVVSIAFSINGGGRVIKTNVLYTDAHILDPGALKLLDRARFVVPADWHARAADEYRYIINFSFELFPLESPVPRSFSAPLPFQGEEWVRITGTTVGAGWVTQGDEGIHGKLVE